MGVAHRPRARLQWHFSGKKTVKTACCSPSGAALQGTQPLFQPAWTVSARTHLKRSTRELAVASGAILAVLARFGSTSLEHTIFSIVPWFWALGFGPLVHSNTPLAHTTPAVAHGTWLHENTSFHLIFMADPDAVSAGLHQTIRSCIKVA